MTVYSKRDKGRGKAAKYALIGAGMSVLSVLGGACAAYINDNILNQEAYAESAPITQVLNSAAQSKGTFVNFSGQKPQEIIVEKENPQPVKSEPPKSELEIQIEKYADANRSALEKFVLTAHKYDYFVSQAAERNNLDINLIYGVIAVESRGDPNAGSEAGARGLMQVMPATAASLGIANRVDPKSVIKASKYLTNQINKYGLELGLAAYNAGPTKVGRLIETYGKNWNKIKKHLPKETQQYVVRVLAAREVAKEIKF